MTRDELIELLHSYPNLEVCCAANGYDSSICPVVGTVDTDTVISLSGEYYPVDGFLPGATEGDPKHRVIMLS